MSFGDRNEIRLLRNRYENKRASDEERMVVGDAGIYCWNFQSTYE